MNHDPEADRVRAALQVLRAHDAKHAPTFEHTAHVRPAPRVLAWRKIAMPLAAAAALVLVVGSHALRPRADLAASAAGPVATGMASAAPVAMASAPTVTVAVSAQEALPLDFLLEDTSFGALLSNVPTFDVSDLSPKVRP